MLIPAMLMSAMLIPVYPGNILMQIDVCVLRVLSVQCCW